MNRIARIPVWVICVLAVAGLACLAFALIGAVVDGPYRPERFIDGIDPVRAGFAGMIVAVLAVFVLLALAGFVSRRMGIDRNGRDLTVFWIGATIAAASVLALIVSMPPVVRVSMPMEIRVPFFFGLGVAGLGLLLSRR
jgi:hypothetical protein